MLSIYFHDPNGIRLEITTPIDEDWNNHPVEAERDLALWISAKKKAAAEGADPVKAMTDLAQEVRKRYGS